MYFLINRRFVEWCTLFIGYVLLHSLWLVQLIGLIGLRG